MTKRIPIHETHYWCHLCSGVMYTDMAEEHINSPDCKERAAILARMPRHKAPVYCECGVLSRPKTSHQITPLHKLLMKNKRHLESHIAS